MTAIVDRPMSALNDLENTVQQQRRRNSVEIIDVDEYCGQFGEPSSSSSSQQSRPAPRPILRGSRSQPEPIFLVDSDDDEDISFPRVLAGHSADRQRSHRRLISPPPRNVPGITIPMVPPPVPPVPRQYAGYTSFPMRRNPPPFPEPPVVPSAEPFAFEIIDDDPAAGPSNRPESSRRSTPRAAPSSHHTPAMGLGGALISSNNTRAQQEAAHAASAATRRRRPRWQDFAPRRARQALPQNANILLHNDDDDPPQVRSFWSITERYFVDRYHQLTDNRVANPPQREKEAYQQAYTHAPQPEPGYTFDFTVSSGDDEDRPRARLFPPTSIHAPIVVDDDGDVKMKPGAGSSSSASSSSAAGKETSAQPGKLTALLVCARCLDPLILNAGLVPEESQFRRVWGLRCGHLIDEKCLNEIGQPSIEAEQEQQQKMDPKGKGKGKAVQRATYSDALPELKQAAVYTNNIRSRLRSRHTNPSSSATAAPSSTSDAATSPSSSAAAAAAAQPDHPPPAKRRRISKSASSKPKVESLFEWKCPVGGCGHVHVSVKMDGIWGPEKEVPGAAGAGAKDAAAGRKEARGVIAVFA